MTRFLNVGRNAAVCIAIAIAILAVSVEFYQAIVGCN